MDAILVEIKSLLPGTPTHPVKVLGVIYVLFFSNAIAASNLL